MAALGPQILKIKGFDQRVQYIATELITYINLLKPIICAVSF